MKKIVKIAVIAVVVILAIALIAPAALRGKIADIVKREANAMLAARLDFEKLDISLLRHFPNASVELKGLTLVGVDRFEGDTIVAARRISVVVNLMSLFGDSGFEVTKVILASPAVHAHKLADGAVSWDVMKPAEEVPAEEPAPSSFRLSVRDFRISDAAIRYEDDSTNMRFSTAPLSLRLRGNMSADRTDLDLRLTAAAMHSAVERRRGGACRRDRRRPCEQPLHLLAQYAASERHFGRSRRLGRTGRRRRGHGPQGRLRQGAVQGRAVADPGLLHP